MPSSTGKLGDTALIAELLLLIQLEALIALQEKKRTYCAFTYIKSAASTYIWILYQANIINYKKLTTPITHNNSVIKISATFSGCCRIKRAIYFKIATDVFFIDVYSEAKISILHTALCHKTHSSLQPTSFLKRTESSMSNDSKENATKHLIPLLQPPCTNYLQNKYSHASIVFV